MSDAFNKARQVKITAMIGEVILPITGVSLTHEVGQLPYGEFSVQLDNQGASSAAARALGSVRLDLARINNLNRLLQEKIINDFGLSPDASIRIQDGDGNEIVFNGFVGQPSTKLRDGQFGTQFTIVHSKAVLQCYNPQIYSFQDVYANQPIDENKLKATASIAERVQILVDQARGNYIDHQDPTSDAFRARPVHNLNELVYPMLQDVLTTSKDLTTIEGINVDAFSPNCLHQVLMQNLTMGEMDFYHYLNFLCQAFFFQLNANWESKLWLERMQTLDDPGNRVIEVPLESFSFNISTIFTPPVVQVLVLGDAVPFYAYKNTLVTNEPDVAQAVDVSTIIAQTIDSKWLSFRALAVYPDQISENAAGVYRFIRAPSWINKDGLTVIDAQVDAIAADQGRHKGYITRANAQFDILSAQGKAQQNVMRYLAEAAYKDEFLKPCTGYVTIPLNLAVAAGRTYDVKSITGESIFTGYLDSVRHDIQITQEGGSAITALTFSHIRAPGAVLRPLEIANSGLVMFDFKPSNGVSATSAPVSVASNVASKTAEAAVIKKTINELPVNSVSLNGKVITDPLLAAQLQDEINAKILADREKTRLDSLKRRAVDNTPVRQSTL